MSPVEVSLNATCSGAWPELGTAVKEALTGAAAGTVTVWLTLLQKGFSPHPSLGSATLGRLGESKRKVKVAVSVTV
jgi:hypothetical protein